MSPWSSWMVRTPCAPDTAAGRLDRPLAPTCGPPRHAPGGHPAAGHDRGAHGVENCVAHSPNRTKLLHSRVTRDQYRVLQHSRHLARYSRRVICLTDCRSGRPRVCRSPYGQHRTAGIDNIRAVDEAGMMPGLTSVPAAARGVRGRSRLEGVVLTWRLMLGGGAETLCGPGF